MPKRLKIASHLSLEELEQRFRTSQEVTERSHWQVIKLLAHGQLSEQVAATSGYGVAWVRQLAARYNQGGPAALGDRRHANPGPKPLLAATAQEKLRHALQEPVPEQLGGGLWNGPKVAAWMAQQLGCRVHPQRGQEALRALGYSCQAPRPRHAQADPVAQEVFKKRGQKQ
jgi:transposase